MFLRVLEARRQAISQILSQSLIIRNTGLILAYLPKVVRLSASPHVYHFEFESFEALLPGGIILRFALQGGDHRIRDFASRGFSAKIRTLILSEVTVSIAFKSFAAAFFSPRLSDTRS